MQSARRDAEAARPYIWQHRSAPCPRFRSDAPISGARRSVEAPREQKHALIPLDLRANVMACALRLLTIYMRWRSWRVRGVLAVSFLVLLSASAVRAQSPEDSRLPQAAPQPRRTGYTGAWSSTPRQQVMHATRTWQAWRWCAPPARLLTCSGKTVNYDAFHGSGCRTVVRASSSRGRRRRQRRNEPWSTRLALGSHLLGRRRRNLYRLLATSATSINATSTRHYQLDSKRSTPSSSARTASGFLKFFRRVVSHAEVPLLPVCLVVECVPRRSGAGRGRWQSELRVQSVRDGGWRHHLVADRAQHRGAVPLLAGRRTAG